MRTRAHIKSHPIHPMLVAFPIGLWVASFVFDLLGVASGNIYLHIAAYYSLIGGCLGAVLAAIPGAIDLFGSVPPNSSARRRGYIHGSLNALALLLFTYIAVRRGDPMARPSNVSLALELLGVFGIGVSGWLGGTLAYRNQIGVDHRYANAGQEKERTLDSWDHPVLNRSELSDGQMLLAKIAGERVVVGRCAEGFFAFSDHCTHRGGPLYDGALVGCTVQCPWHGSQFDITTGRVVAGPAKSKIKLYQTEIRGNEVYVLPESRELKKAA
ncbi:MAG: Rieske 2Fe-2S domain-containing protein [Acidobacteriales bacterium]|nr:Rieske 2Fe-2S domain-containing protein [Terriglobales bacterium]